MDATSEALTGPPLQSQSQSQPLTRRGLLLSAGGAAATTALTAGLATGAADAADAAEAPPTAFPLHLPDMPLRDPFVVADAASGLYHLFVTNAPTLSGTPGAGTMVYRSRNLRDWSAPLAVFTPTPDLWASRGAWAPEVHRWKGRWYLLTTLHDTTKPLPLPQAGDLGIPVQIPQHRRGTVIAVSDSLLGPFTVVDPTRPVAPPSFMTLDGTLFKDDRGRPWMVYAHEWIQKIDGTVEAVRLKDDLSGPVGKPIHLFKGSDATWLGEEMPAPSANQILPYVTDGPELIRLPGGALAMLWSTFEKNTNSTNGVVNGGYVQTLAVSPSGRLHGPWLQKRPLVRRGTGHGMSFRMFPGTKTAKKEAARKRLLIAHHGGKATRANIWELELRRDGLRLGKQRHDLDGTK